MGRTENRRVGWGLVLAVGLLCLPGCQSPYGTRPLGLHHGDYMALPSDVTGQGTAVIVASEASASGQLEEARFEAAYRGRLETDGQSGTAARCFADILAICFGAS